MDTSEGSPAVSIAAPHRLPAHAFTVAVPAANEYATPGSLASSVMLRTDVLEELQVTEASCLVLPSLNVPEAMNGCAVPSPTAVLLVVNEIDTRFGGVSVAGSYNSPPAPGPGEVGPPLASIRPLANKHG